MIFPPPVLIPVLRVIFILWEMFIEVTLGLHDSSHSHYMRCVSRTFGLLILYIQAYGLEALVAEKVFFLNFYIRKSQTSVISFSLQSNALLGDFDPYGDPYSDSYQREGRVGLEQVGSKDRFFSGFRSGQRCVSLGSKGSAVLSDGFQDSRAGLWQSVPSCVTSTPPLSLTLVHSLTFDNFVTTFNPQQTALQSHYSWDGNGI